MTVATDVKRRDFLKATVTLGGGLLISPNGELVKEFPSPVKPDSADVEKAIETQLSAKG